MLFTRVIIEILSLIKSGIYILTFPFSVALFAAEFICNKVWISILSIGIIQRLWSPRFGTNIFSRFGRVALSYMNVHVYIGSALAGIAVLLLIYQPFLKQFDGQYYVVFQNYSGIATAYAEETSSETEASNSGVLTAEIPIITEIAPTPTPTVKPKVYANQFTTPQDLPENFTPPTIANQGNYHSPLRVQPKMISTYYSKYHPGVDLVSESGTPIYAAADGYVTMAGWSVWGYGNVVYIDNGNGVVTLYAHMSKINASIGQQVNHDSIIGYVGTTGHSTGPHLHFEIQKNGVPFNPLSVINPYTP